MRQKSSIFGRLNLLIMYSLISFLISTIPGLSQQGSYSITAQNILDRENTLNAEASTTAEIFKFSINEILNSADIPVLNANGDPEIFGRTDYGSEFELANDLSTTFEIEIPAFVIDVLAEDKNGEYLPVVINGVSDEADGDYIRSYANDELNAYVEEIYNSNGPNVFSYQYDNRTEIQYLPDEGVNVTHNLYTDGGQSKNYVEGDLRVYTETNSSGYNFINYHDYNIENPIFAIEYNYEDGATAFEINENNERYFQRTNSDSTTEIVYSEDQLEIGQSTQTNGNSTTYVKKTDELGNTQTIRQTETPDGVTTLEYEKNEAAISLNETYIRDTPIINEDGTQSIFYIGSTGAETHIIEELITENGDRSLYIDDLPFLENVVAVVSQADRIASKDALTQQLETLVENGEQSILLSENFDNSNVRSIDLKEFYDEINGQAVTPEMGYVRLVADKENQYINLTTGDVVEFFVRPNESYLENHTSSSELFFFDRPISETPIIAEIDSDGTDYNTNESSPSEEDLAIRVGPGEEAIRSQNEEIKVYVTTLYIPAPASKFSPSQIVMPVESDGTYIYDEEPDAAEKFADDQEVVAIPAEEAKRLSEKVKEIKKEKEKPTNPKHDEDEPPALDPGIEMMIKLNNILIDVQKGPSKLLSETKKKIEKEFPNISNQLVNLIINSANSNEKFDLIGDPKEFLDKELAKISDPIELNSLLGSDLPQEDLIKIYNLIIYKFFTDLTELGFEKLENQKISFSVNVRNADQILEQVQLQQDIIAIASILGSARGNQGLSNLLIEPDEVDLDSSSALFESNKSQKILNKIKRFSEVITLINSQSTVTNDGDQILDDTLPIVEVNVGLGESIADALEEKFTEDKRLNRNFQTRSQSSKLEKFDFEIPPREENTKPSAIPPLLTEAVKISDQELQLVAETTEATNNILDATINRMLTELGSTSIDTDSTQLISAANIQEQPNQETPIIREDTVFRNALSSAQKLRQVEDIRAIFQILGLGS